MMVEFIPAPEVGENVVKCVNTALEVEVFHTPNWREWNRWNGYGCYWLPTTDAASRLVNPTIELDTSDGVSWKIGEPCLASVEETLADELVFVDSAQDKIAAIQSYATKAAQDVEWAQEASTWIAAVLQQIKPCRPTTECLGGVDTTVALTVTDRVWQVFTSTIGRVEYSSPLNVKVNIPSQHFTYRFEHTKPKHDRALTHKAALEELSRVQAWLDAARKYVQKNRL